MDGGLVTPFTGDSSPTDSPPTPSEGIHFTPRRAMTSFDNLVALANHQERLKEARKMVWRDRGQPVVELDDLRACMEHAAAGGLRSATLAFNIRACVNLILALIRIHKVPRDIRFAVVRHAVFGTDTWRFAAMLGTFTSAYKFLINALPILIPAINPSQSLSRYRDQIDSSPFNDDDDDKLDLEAGPTASRPSTTLEVPLSERRARLSLSAHAQLVLIRKKTRKWHAALAGALAGGMAIMWEKRSRRGIIAQQMFVRGLQGSYNSYTTKRGINIPYGDVLVFSLASGQILYAFLLRPDTLPRSYSSWIAQAAKVPLECIQMNLSLVREHTLDVAHLDRVISRDDITPWHANELLSLRSLFLSPPNPSTSPPAYFPHYAPCSTVHPALTSCGSVPLDRFFAVFKWMLPIYGALHFVPAVLFKRKAFSQDPGKVLVRAGLGTMRSSAFLGVFVVIYQTLYCYKHKLHKYLTVLRLTSSPSSRNPLKSLPQPLIDTLISKVSFWFPGFMAGLSLFVEERRRRGELAMYVLPKALESLWIMARGKGWVFRTGNLGEMWLTALGMGMVMSTYQNDPQHLSGFVRRILYQFIGPN